VTPTLPLADLAGFARRLAGFGPAVVVTQQFHDSGGGFGADTGPEARRLLGERGWSDRDYESFVGELRARLPAVYGGEEGFSPPPAGGEGPPPVAPAARGRGGRISLV
jgi:hypothetical protein